MTIPLFPVDVAREITTGLPNSADLKVVAVGRDGFEYAMKRQLEGVDLPASEWFCYHLGYRLQIATPSCVRLKAGGAEHFGSRFEGGVVQWSDVSPVDQKTYLSDGGNSISRIIALDLFVANDDRHLDNFLFRDQKLGGERTVISMDFSRSLLMRNWPVDPVPMPSSTNTMLTLASLKHTKCWSSSDASLMLASIATIRSVEVEQWLSSMPAAWLSTSRIDAIVQWWRSPQFTQRIAECGMLVR